MSENLSSKYSISSLLQLAATTFVGVTEAGRAWGHSGFPLKYNVPFSLTRPLFFEGESMSLTPFSPFPFLIGFPGISMKPLIPSGSTSSEKTAWLAGRKGDAAHIHGSPFTFYVIIFPCLVDQGFARVVLAFT